MSTITVVGAVIGRQFINGDPNWCEWRVSYEIDGRGLYHHTVSSRDARDARGSAAAPPRDKLGFHSATGQLLRGPSWSSFEPGDSYYCGSDFAVWTRETQRAARCVYEWVL